MPDIEHSTIDHSAFFENVTVTQEIIQNLVINETFVTEIFNYATYVTEFTTNVTNIIEAKKGQINELATLDGNGKLTASQIPDKLNPIGVLTFLIDGGGAEITDAKQLDIEIPFACSLTGWTILADQAGDIVIDIWKDTYANFPPTDADSITGGAEPEIVASATKAQSNDLTGWTVALAAGDILRINVDSCTSITRATLALRYTR